MSKIHIYVACLQDGCWREISFKDEPNFNVDDHIQNLDVSWLFHSDTIDLRHPFYSRYAEQHGIELTEDGLDVHRLLDAVSASFNIHKDTDTFCLKIYCDGLQDFLESLKDIMDEYERDDIHIRNLVMDELIVFTVSNDEAGDQIGISFYGIDIPDGYPIQNPEDFDDEI